MVGLEGLGQLVELRREVVGGLLNEDADERLVLRAERRLQVCRRYAVRVSEAGAVEQSRSSLHGLEASASDRDWLMPTAERFFCRDHTWPVTPSSARMTSCAGISSSQTSAGRIGEPWSSNMQPSRMMDEPLASPISTAPRSPERGGPPTHTCSLSLNGEFSTVQAYGA